MQGGGGGTTGAGGIPLRCRFSEQVLQFVDSSGSFVALLTLKMHHFGCKAPLHSTESGGVEDHGNGGGGGIR